MVDVLRDRLRFELQAKRALNPRYSLRAFATALGTDHSTLSQVMRGTRPATARLIRSAGKALGLSPEEISVLVAAEHAPDPATVKRQSQLTHWTAEALAVLKTPIHAEIVRLSRVPGFVADCRWLASQTHTSLDEVNIALSRLLRLGLIDGNWRDSTGLSAFTPEAFRKLALVRIRAKAAEDGVKLTQKKN